jgi:hypothetical protein
LLPGQQTKAVNVTVGDDMLKIGDKIYYMENLDYGIILKLVFGDGATTVLKPGFNQFAEYTINYRVLDIKPPQLMVKLEEYLEAPDMTPRDAYETIREWVESTIAHPLDIVKDAIAAYTLYTWFHRFYQKKAFLLVTGFYGTGKSVVGNIIKAFGRYTVQTEPGLKTSEWEVALLLGTMLVDEAETLKRQHLAKLRRMHDEGYTVSKMMGAPGGWMVLTLNLSAPVVLIGTHLPEDPALVSRGIVIKMHYGTPPLKPPTINSPVAREFRASALKMVVKHYKMYIDKLSEAEVRGTSLNMRERDVYTPVCAAALAAGQDKVCDELKILVKLSSYIAQTLTPGRRLATIVAKLILDNGERVGRFIRIPEPELYHIVTSYAKAYNVDPNDAKYVLQYFISAAYTKTEGDVTYLYFLEDDVRVAKGEEIDLLEVWRQHGLV